MIKEGEGPKIKGSIMLAFAESKEDVLKALQEDIYFKEGVWDWSQVQIHPVCLDTPAPQSPSVPLMIISLSLLLGNLFRVSTTTVNLRPRAYTCNFCNQ